MPSLHPISVTVGAKKWSCILDTSLALSTYGLLLTQRLGDEFDLWLVRELWQILDNTQYYLAHPERILPKAQEAGQAGEGRFKRWKILSETLGQWELARIQTDMAGLNVFWIGDAVRESLFPPGIDQDLLYRFETLAGTLDQRIDRRCAGEYDRMIMDCCRDAAALTAALMPYKGFILTQRDAGDNGSAESEPFICSCLKEWGMKCQRVKEVHRLRDEKNAFNPLMARTGLSELIWAGLNLAAVHVIAPQAVIMPRMKGSDDDYADGLDQMSGDKMFLQKDWWKDASCFWYPL